MLLKLRYHFFYCSIIALLLSGNSLIGQINLVPNPSFEQYTTCPQGFFHEHPSSWYQPDKWGGGGYYNACRPISGSVPNTGHGFQYAHSGVAMIAMAYYNNNSNNYFQTRLLDSLKSVKYYFISYYVVNPKDAKLSCNNISLLFTKSAIYADTINNIKIIPANPQVVGYGNPIITDTSQWTKISAIFKAQGGEIYITLGNFKYTSQTNYIINNPNAIQFSAAYFVDDVSVIPLDSFCLKADASRDTTITLGDSVFIGSYTNGLDSVKWFVNGITLIDSIRPGFWVKPTVTTSYVLQQTINGCFSADTVVVNVGAVPLKFTSLTLNPSPKGEGLETHIVWSTANEINVKQFNIQRSTNSKDFTTIGTVKAQNKSSNEYNFTDDKLPITNDQLTLYYRLQSIDKDGKKQYSETRTLNIKPQTLNNVFIYPNPTKDVVTIECKDGIKEVRMLDMMGREMRRKVFRQAQNGIQQNQNNNGVSNSLLWRVGEAKGLYLLKITTLKNIEYNEKILVQ